MSQYMIFTDSGCDIPSEILQDWGVKACDLIFRFTDSDVEYTNDSMPSKEFYDMMRAGKIAKTSAVNVETFKEAFEAALKEGQDVLYLGFSGGLSNTANAGRLAVEELREAYPDRKIIAVDSLCASAGQGLLLRLALDRKEEGASIDEVAAYLEENKLHLCHEFTVDDLVYLKRGGRVSPTVALIGTMLSIKPVMHMDDEGHLAVVSKARGRKASLKQLVEEMKKTAIEPETQEIFICHGDALAEAEALGECIRRELQVKNVIINYVGPVIGAHTGPGVISIFFLGTKR